MPHSINTLCISGWAQHHDGLQVLSEQHTLHLDYAGLPNLNAAVDAICSVSSQFERIIGWSLGGVIAMHAISQRRISCKQLVLLATPAQFVASTDFSHGMDTLTFSLFHDNYHQDSHRTAKRFSQLITHGDIHHARITPHLATSAFSADKDVWQPWLTILKHTQHSHFKFLHFPPTLIIHGLEDTVVKHAQSIWLAQQIPLATHISMPSCGHAPHYHDPKAVIDMMAQHAAKHCL